MAKQPNKYVADEVRDAWRQSHSNGLLCSLLRLIGMARPAEVIYIAEHASGTWDTAHCTGDPVTVWAYRGSDFKQVEALGDLDCENRISSRTSMIRYCLHEDGQRMIHNSWRGVRAGYGDVLRRVGDSWESEGRSWVS